jgi:hydroxymethylpyrimidine pyrophosphatase-like HAD family hydrolase
MAHKGSALEFFAARLGVAQSRTLAVGDDVNDIAMLEWAGYSVVMSHANEETRTHADAVLPGTNGRAAPEQLAEYLLQLARLRRYRTRYPSRAAPQARC